MRIVSFLFCRIEEKYFYKKNFDSPDTINASFGPTVWIFPILCDFFQRICTYSRDIKQAWLPYQFFFHTNSKQTTAYFVITPQYYRICALTVELPQISALFRFGLTSQTTKFSIIHDNTVPSVISLRMIKFYGDFSCRLQIFAAE